MNESVLPLLAIILSILIGLIILALMKYRKLHHKINKLLEQRNSSRWDIRHHLSRMYDQIESNLDDKSKVIYMEILCNILLSKQKINTDEMHWMEFSWLNHRIYSKNKN